MSSFMDSSGQWITRRRCLLAHVSSGASRCTPVSGFMISRVIPNLGCRRELKRLSVQTDSFLPDAYQLRVLRYPQRYAKTEALMVKAPIFQDAIKLRNVLDCQAKILEAVMD